MKTSTKKILVAAGITAGAVIVIGGIAYAISKPPAATEKEIDSIVLQAAISETDPAVLRIFAAKLRAVGRETQAVMLEGVAGSLEHPAFIAPVIKKATAYVPWLG